MNRYTVVQRKPDSVFSKMDEEVVMMCVEKNKYFGLNPVGSKIWGLIEKPISVQQLIDKLLDEYEVDEELCFSETVSYLDDLYRKGLIIIDEKST